jgi:hypothetical protein
MSKEKKEVQTEGECRVCSEPTNNTFNISYSPARICEHCAQSIFIQQAEWYIKNLKPNK